MVTPTPEQTPEIAQSPITPESILDAVIPQSPLKRKASPNVGEESEEKRQRTEPSDLDTGIDDFDFAKLIADATSKATESFQQESADGDMVSIKDEMAMTDGNVYSHSNEFMRRESLPILDSVSTELLAALVEGPYEETVKMMTDPTSDPGQSYLTKKSLFDQTKEMYAPPTKFLSAEKMGITEPSSIATVRTANTAIFANTIFGGKDVGFYALNDSFLEIFVPEGEDLGEELGTLLLGLKTQIYLSVMSAEEQEREKGELLGYLFPDTFGVRLLERHPEKEMTLAESKFLTETGKRRSLLSNENTDADSIAALSDKYGWEEYLRAFNDFLHKKYQPILHQSRTGVSQYSYLFQGNGNKAQQNGHGNGVHDSKSTITDQEIMDEAARAALTALQSVGVGDFSHDGLPNHSMMQHYQQNSHHPQHAHNSFKASIPFPSQSAPTQVLYEQARQASANKSAPHARRPGLPSQRKPWSTDEENALMAGLDQVRGPHWSQILALYGPKGQVSEILKGRNQVQLKDKARNLKLFFLKSNIEVPYYLQCVTGELKTRAPSLAQRKEAEERARMAEVSHGVGMNGQHGQVPQYHQQFPPQLQQQQHHQSPYRQSPYSQPPPPQHLSQQHPQQRVEHGSIGQDTEILDPVGPASSVRETKPENQPAPLTPVVSEPIIQSQEQAVQKAMQEMSADEHSLASRLRAEVDRHDAVEKASTITKS